MKINATRLWPLTLTLLLVSGHVCEVFGFDRESALEISQGAIGRQLDNYQFRDTTGRSVNIADFQGKPLVVSLIFTSCHHICPTTTKHLADVVSKARDALGADSFNVVTIGFDVFRDTPVMMRSFRDKQRVTDEHWQFLSADARTIEQLSSQLGFLYEKNAAGFDHLIQASVIDSEGKVIQQVYGMKFDVPLLIEPLKRIVFGGGDSTSILTSLSKKIRLFCTVYDPSRDTYRFDYSIFINFFIGFVSVLILGIVLVKEWRKTLRNT